VKKLNASYPIGPLKKPVTVETVRLVQELELMPEKLRQTVAGLTPKQLDTQYRENGWTVRQVVHHIADAQMNSYIRIKLALTEDEPTIKPYDEAAWAELGDVRNAPVEAALKLHDAIMEKYVLLMRALDENGFSRSFIHPVSGKETIREHLAFSVWHGQHHMAQIASLRQRMNW
jgi:uncharacterized damage-inducible protein DinB